MALLNGQRPCRAREPVWVRPGRFASQMAAGTPVTAGRTILSAGAEAFFGQRWCRCVHGYAGLY